MIKKEQQYFCDVINSEHNLADSLPISGVSKKGYYLRVREFRADDKLKLAEVIERMHSTKKKHTDIFWAFEYDDEIKTPEGLAERFLNWAESEREEEPRNVHRLAIVDKKDNVVGGVTLNMLVENDTPLHDYADIGYFLDDSQKGRGLAKASLALVMPYYYKHHNTAALVIHPDNDASQAVAKSSGAELTDIPVETEPFTDYKQYLMFVEKAWQNLGGASVNVRKRLPCNETIEKIYGNRDNYYKARKQQKLIQEQRGGNVSI